MTAHDLDALARETIALGEAATPGPWRECGHDRNGCKCGIVWSIPVDHTVVSPVRSGEESVMPESIVKANAALIAAYRTSAPALATALLDARETMRIAIWWFGAPGVEPNAEFERMAEEFYRSTGYLRPGKSLPIEMCGDDYEAKRRAAWDAWVTENSMQVRARLESALRSGAGQGEGGGG